MSTSSGGPRARLLAWATQGLIPEIAPWVGTTVGGAVISSAAGHWWQMGIGAVVIALGVTPPGLRAYASKRVQRQDDVLDARERIAATLVMGAINDAADLEEMPRQERVKIADQRIDILLDDLHEKLFEGVPGLRVVLFKLSDDGSRLEMAAVRGRPSSARGFNDDHPDSAIAIGRLTADEDYLIVDDTAHSGRTLSTDGRTYRSFIAAPVRSNRAAYGMLAVDSTKAGVFDPRDADMVVSVASTLAFYLASQERGRHGRTKMEASQGGDE